MRAIRETPKYMLRMILQTTGDGICQSPAGALTSNAHHSVSRERWRNLRGRSVHCSHLANKATNAGRAGNARWRSACRSMVGLAGMLVVVAASVASAAADDHDGEIDRWVPSAALELGLMGHTGKGNISGTDVNTTDPDGGRIDIPQPIRSGDFPTLAITEPLASREQILAFLVGGTFELMTPRLMEGFASPRLFMDANLSDPFGLEVGLARDGDPGVMEFPFPPSNIGPIGEGAVVGRGHKITIQHQGLQLHAGLGAAFTFDLGPNRIRLKPSFVYSRIKQVVSTTSRRAVRRTNEAGTFADINDPEDYRLIIFDDVVEEVYHGIGPALEVELEPGSRMGPFSLSLFVKGHATRLFGDVTTDITATNEAFPEEQVFYKYSQDRWVYRASTGIRLRLVPQKRRRR